ncbi:hypothetical protein [Gottfriedia luciferensis]|nr:hypothetical protein [Gottfriedia luciferensis]
MEIRKATINVIPELVSLVKQSGDPTTVVVTLVVDSTYRKRGIGKNLI